MINIEDLTIKQARELAGLFTGKPTASKDLGMQIVVLDRGFVYIGKTTIEGDYVQITEARNVRKWGTTNGLGQLAESGPTSNTVMDKCQDITAPLKSVIHFMSCKHSF